ncbi:PREDICTED: uncharacterized protein LOC109587432 [Amphimedon queenslandica]|uniref:dCMP deaminase n=1 Tax=Amphimedon queenslandica TaxID=400682 RepID=A0AAN0JQB9_AMPQE|nr:PREDICTED: uncharacterized protein LOC109587432 [Amphimedon queenslandica]|eukprot:XP_019859230.1 PREDICTED: uncharacterized protein LOC109587432 [Amphimedon queenslandica]
MEDEMKTIEAEIQKWEARDKTSEYIEQMKQVEDEMNHECRKIIAEMKKMQKAKEKLEKSIENKIEDLKKLNEKAKELELSTRIKKAQRLKTDVHEMKEKLRTSTEKDIEKLIKEADDSLTENDVQGLLKGVKLLTEEEIKSLLEVIAGKSGDDKKELLEAVKSLTENEMEIMQDQAKSIKLERIRQWEEYYMNIACLAALRSKDPSTPVGACIVDTESYQIVGIGYNSMPYVKGGHNDKIFKWKGSEKTTPDKDEDSTLKYPFVVHAAVNAITNRTRDKLDGCILYTTIHPDEDCARAIQVAGIKEVVYSMFTRKEGRIMASDMERSRKIFKANKIETRYR